MIRFPFPLYHTTPKAFVKHVNKGYTRCMNQLAFGMGNYQGGEYGVMGQMGSWGPEGWMLAALALAAPLILLVLLWSIVWKGLALWHSARRAQPWWFTILLVVNTLGILEIIYLFFVAKLKFKDLFSTHSGHVHAEHHTHHTH
jgi:hypothetical protein